MRPARWTRVRRQPWWGLVLLIGMLLAAQWLLERTRRQGVPDAPVTGHARLIDGDSFHLGSDEVRLVGIDAPEGRQTCMRNQRSWPCGDESRRELARLIAGQPLTCQATERDQHGRLLARCSVNGRELNREMVASGFAVAYGNYGREEAAARSARKGLWSGEFEPPRQWRRQQGSGRD